jgi:hypothetical protein
MTSCTDLTSHEACSTGGVKSHLRARGSLSLAQVRDKKPVVALERHRENTENVAVLYLTLLQLRGNQREVNLRKWVMHACLDADLVQEHLSCVVRVFLGEDHLDGHIGAVPVPTDTHSDHASRSLSRYHTPR